MSKPKILVVEDDKIIMLHLTKTLERLGYDVVENISSVGEILEKIENKMPDLIMMDINLGGESDGIEAASKIRNRFDLPVIFLTAYSDEKTLHKAKMTEPYAYLIKPFEDNELYFTIEIALYKNSIEKQMKEKNAILVSMQYELEKLNNELEKRVRERTAQVENLLKQKDYIISQLGHDLKTPLTPILALMPALFSEENDPKKKKMLGLILENAKYMNILVASMLELAGLDSPDLMLESSVIDLGFIINQSICALRHISDRKKIEIKSDIQEELFVEADEIRLREVLDKILNNALKFTRSGGNITVSGIKNGSDINVCIKDNGIGIQNEQLSEVFSEFYKIDESRHDRSSVGLGLSICRKIIEKFNGRIWAESEGDGKGSAFYIALPKAEIAEAGIKV